MTMYRYTKVGLNRGDTVDIPENAILVSITNWAIRDIAVRWLEPIKEAKK
jgi:hypothetical protein